MTDNPNSSRHVSYDQVKTIIDFMGQHVDFAKGSLRSLEARQTSKSLWNDLTKILNNSRSGTKKTSDGWSKYWSDFKNKLKNKVNVLKKRRPGSALSKNLKPLTRLEKRVLVILGPHFERKISKAPADPFSNISIYPMVVKQESYNENGNNNLGNNLSESSDRQSVLDLNNRMNDSVPERCSVETVSGCLPHPNESNESEDSNMELEDNLDEENEPILHSIYPKWLIDIEKKRAEADLIRAKAEEQRANVAVKNAEAALVQAEALKKLADAAVIQAEALSNIAGVYSARRQITPI